MINENTHFSIFSHVSCHQHSVNCASNKSTIVWAEHGHTCASITIGNCLQQERKLVKISRGQTKQLCDLISFWLIRWQP